MIKDSWEKHQSLAPDLILRVMLVCKSGYMSIGVLMEYIIDAHDVSRNGTRVSTGKSLVEVNNVCLSQISPGMSIVATETKL